MSKPRLWLSCPPIEPVPVTTEPVIIGREKECDLYLPHQAVSRRHGMVRAVGREVVYENKSKQGTIVNGRKVTFMCKLSVGDTLEIGPYKIAAQDAPAQEVAMDGTIALDKTGLALKKKLQQTLIEVRRLEAAVKAKAAEAEAKAAEADAKGREVATTRRELESEVWRGFAVNRDLAEAREKAEALQRQIDEQVG